MVTSPLNPNRRSTARSFARLLTIGLAIGIGVSACGEPEASTAPPDIELVTTVLPTTTPLGSAGLDGLARTDSEVPPTTSSSVPLAEAEEALIDDASAPPTTTAVTSTDPTTSALVPATVAPQTTTTTTIDTIPPWRLGLINSASSTSDAYRVGVEAAVAWRNTDAGALGRRLVELTSCAPTDAATAAGCASNLLGSADAIIRGIDLHPEITRPALVDGGVAVLGGYALWAEDLDGGLLLDVGGTPATAAALADHASSNGTGTVAVFHDDTAAGRAIVDAAVVPVLAAAGFVVEVIAVPTGTTDATGAVAPAVAASADRWIVLTGPSSCNAIAASHRQFGATAVTWWATPCAGDTQRADISGQVAEAWFAFELVESSLLPMVGSDLRSALELAELGISQIDPVLASDPLALRGWVTGLRVSDLLRFVGPDAAQAALLRQPHPLSLGSIDCSVNSVCAGDVMLVEHLDGSPVGGLVVANGVAQLP